MKILMVNKFLHPNGGSETYIFKLGAYLQTIGHEVQYFGMDHADRIVGNQADAYTQNMDFHGGSKLSKLLYPIKTIYSCEARRKIRLVLDAFQPDVCHLNNFNYQLTPSIILEIRKWEKDTGHQCRIIYTAHDYQLICPNHMLYDPNRNQICEKCIGGHFGNCVKGKCIHGSMAKSAVGSLEAFFWNKAKVYDQIDTIICCSHFMKSKLDTNSLLAKKTVVIHNFVDDAEPKSAPKKDYVLYFGRFSREKGIATLVQAAKELPEISFVFAGAGPLAHLLEDIPNIRNVGFKTGEELKTLIREARFAVCPSEWYEPFGLTIAEAIISLTPVLASSVGGIPELIECGKTGELVACGNAEELRESIVKMWSSCSDPRAYLAEDFKHSFMCVPQYVELLQQYYAG